MPNVGDHSRGRAVEVRGIGGLKAGDGCAEVCRGPGQTPACGFQTPDVSSGKRPD